MIRVVLAGAGGGADSIRAPKKTVLGRQLFEELIEWQRLDAVAALWARAEEHDHAALDPRDVVSNAVRRC